MQNFLTPLVGTLGLCCAMVAAESSGQTDVKRGLPADLPSGSEVVARINNRDEGLFVSRNLSIQLIDRRGKVRLRETATYRKYYGADKYTILFYQAPKNVKDTAFLTFDYSDDDREDDQWLYLPAMRKVRRISASDRGDYFLGTDLSYEDVKLETRISFNDYTHTALGHDQVDGHPCILIESIPVNDGIARELGYSKVQSCVDTQIWMARLGNFWDIGGNFLKTVHAMDIRRVQGIWTQHVIEVKNHKTGHQTILTYDNVDYQTELDDSLFTKNALLRGN
jgi:uncharacterized protein